MCGGDAWRDKKLFVETYDCSIETVVYSASSAAVERFFSLKFWNDQAHSQKQTAAKLVYCYRMLRGSEEIEW